MSLSNRFYEGLCDPYPQEPTRDKFLVVDTDDKGQGVLSLTSFKPGDLVFKFYGNIVDKQTLMTLQIEKGKYIEDGRIMGKILHSCDPNLRADMKELTFYAVKKINPNEYLTMDYETTEDILFRSFECCCGSPKCRGQIKGRQFTQPDRQSEY